ncbi:MAG: GNAT family N-acetyltransferase [Devosiaceae bacterium]
MSLAFIPDQAASLPYGYDWLAQNAVESNIFYEPAFLVAGLQHLADESVEMCVAREPESAIPLAAIPLRRARRRYGPLPTPVPLVAWLHPYAMACTPLVSPEAPVQALQKLLEKAASRRDGPQVLLLPLMRTDGPVWPLLLQALTNTNRRHALLQTHSRAGVNQPRSAEITLRSLTGKKSCRSINRSREKLSAIGAVSHRTVTQPPDLSAALQTFLALEAFGWKGQKGTALQTAGHDRFAAQAVEALAAGNRARIDITYLDDVAIAATVSLRDGTDCAPRWMPWKTAYDERYANYGAGSLSLAQLTETLLSEAQNNDAPFVLDSLADEGSVIANRLWRQRWQLADVLIDLVPGGSSAYRAIAMAERTRKRAYDAARAARELVRNAKTRKTS